MFLAYALPYRRLTPRLATGRPPTARGESGGCSLRPKVLSPNIYCQLAWCTTGHIGSIRPALQHPPQSPWPCPLPLPNQPMAVRRAPATPIGDPIVLPAVPGARSAIPAPYFGATHGSGGCKPRQVLRPRVIRRLARVPAPFQVSCRCRFRARVRDLGSLHLRRGLRVGVVAQRKIRFTPGLVACPLSARGAVLHLPTTPHHAGPNTTPRQRRAYMAAMVAPSRKRERPVDTYWTREKKTAGLKRATASHPGTENGNRAETACPNHATRELVGMR